MTVYVFTVNIRTDEPSVDPDFMTTGIEEAIAHRIKEHGLSHEEDPAIASLLDVTLSHEYEEPDHA